MASEQLMKRMQKIKNRMDNSKGNYYKMQDGDNYLRFCPSWRGDDEEWCVILTTHYSLGPEGKAGAACLEANFGKRCPACHYMRRLDETGVAADNQTAYQMRPQPRVLLNALPDNDPEQRIKIISLSDAAFTKLLGLYQDQVDGGDFMDPKEGFIVNMKRVKKGGVKSRSTFSEYEVHAARENCRIARKKWRDELNNLDAEVARQELPPKRIIAIMRGEDTNDG